MLDELPEIIRSLAFGFTVLAIWGVFKYVFAWGIIGIILGVAQVFGS